MLIKTLNHKQILNLLPDRALESHKGDFGKVLLLCGSKGYTGAAALAALGALRTGAGLVYLGVPEAIYRIEATKLLEPVVLSLSDDSGHLSVDAIVEIDNLLQGKDALLIGPGLGQSTDVKRIVEHVLTRFQGPIVLDADGINAIQTHRDILRGRTAPTILTPHAGEFERIFPEYTSNRIVDAATFAQTYGVITLLKGHHSVITDGRTCYLNTTGNPGMAVGGSGDVLAGMIVSLIGQGIAPLKATAIAAWLHGAAGDICAQEWGQYGMLPSDMLHVLPRLLK